MAQVYFDEELLSQYGGKGEAIQSISMLVTDMPEKKKDKSVASLARKVEQRLEAEFGNPDFVVRGKRRKPVWRFPNVPVGILVMHSAIGIRIMNPRYQHFLEKHHDY